MLVHQISRWENVWGESILTTLEPENIFRHSGSQHDKLQLGTIADNWIITLDPSRTINMPRPSFLPSLTPHSLQECISSSIRTPPRCDQDWEGKLPRKQFHEVLCHYQVSQVDDWKRRLRVAAAAQGWSTNWWAGYSSSRLKPKLQLLEKSKMENFYRDRL